MTTRKQHIAEMRYALAHNCTLADAKQALARTRERAAQEFLRRLENRPVGSGNQHQRPRTEIDVSGNAPWMMRD